MHLVAEQTSARPTNLPLPRDVALGTPTRPSWRGRTHLIALVLSVPLLSLLIAGSDGARERWGLVIYAIGLTAMLGASTTYHRWVHTVRWRTRWRRADHAMIFLAIAGTCTPLALAVLSTRLAVVMLSIVWAAAIVGVTIKLAGWRRADRAASAMYITNGWAGTMLIPAMASNGQWTALVLLMSGGLVYTFGALGFARQWPTLRPHVFSFHEVWHLCTLAAAAAHFIAIWSVIG